MLERADIERMIPHSGLMVLLDRVIFVDQKSIKCIAISHRHRHHPLHSNGRLHSVNGAEYGAQAAAIHGPALGAPRGGSGLVVLLQDISWNRPFLDDIEGPLEVRAECIRRDAKHLVYRFSLWTNDVAIVNGECGIILG